MKKRLSDRRPTEEKEEAVRSKGVDVQKRLAISIDIEISTEVREK